MFKFIKNMFKKNKVTKVDELTHICQELELRKLRKELKDIKILTSRHNLRKMLEKIFQEMDKEN